MQNPRTTICGAVAAAAGALAAIPTLPAAVHTAAIAVSAVAVALLGFFASDGAVHTVKVNLVMLGLCAAGAALVLSAYSIAGLRATAVIPTIGDYSVTLAGGTIGNRPIITTNSPTCIGTNCTASIGSGIQTNQPPPPPRVQQ